MSGSHLVLSSSSERRPQVFRVDRREDYYLDFSDSWVLRSIERPRISRFFCLLSFVLNSVPLIAVRSALRPRFLVLPLLHGVVDWPCEG